MIIEKERPALSAKLSSQDIGVATARGREPGLINRDPNSYGFRPKRSTADAIGQCFNALSSKHSAEWIFEGDISACFDRLDHTWFQDHIPMDKLILGKWLAAGYMEEGIVFPSDAGSPQGGIASPTLANRALDGLESAAHKAASHNQKINVIRYADDIVMVGSAQRCIELPV